MQPLAAALTIHSSAEQCMTMASASSCKTYLYGHIYMQCILREKRDATRPGVPAQQMMKLRMDIFKTDL